VNLVTRDTRNAECHKLIALPFQIEGHDVWCHYGRRNQMPWPS